MSAARIIRHANNVNGCGGAWVGDWDTVACDKCGLRRHTLDAGYADTRDDEVLRLDNSGRLVAVAV
jgi:hypothetical protein